MGCSFSDFLTCAVNSGILDGLLLVWPRVAPDALSAPGDAADSCSEGIVDGSPTAARGMAPDGCSAAGSPTAVSMATPPAPAASDCSWEKTVVNRRSVRNNPSPQIFIFRDCLMVSQSSCRERKLNYKNLSCENLSPFGCVAFNGHIFYTGALARSPLSVSLKIFFVLVSTKAPMLTSVAKSFDPADSNLSETRSAETPETVTLFPAPSE